MSITFIIPTWNKSEYLDKCVRSIAEQVNDEKIIISDHGSTDGTEDTITRLCEDFPFIGRRYCARTAHPDFSHNFRFAFQQADTEWTWTFGDDDLLLPGALDTVRNLCSSDRADFFHLAEEGRATHTNKAIPGTLLSLCNILGWLDMTGFITGNVVRTKYLHQAVNSPSWDIYARSSFPQSLALLEVLADRPAAFIDGKFIAPQQIDAPLTLEHWAGQGIAQRYHFIVDGLEDMVLSGKIPQELKNPFFRYHSYYLWDRLIGHMINDYYYAMTPASLDRWPYIERFSKFLDADSKAILDGEIKMVQDSIAAHYGSIQKLKADSELVDAFAARHNMERFPFNYLPDQDAESESLIVRSGLIGVTH